MMFTFDKNKDGKLSATELNNVGSAQDPLQPSTNGRCGPKGNNNKTCPELECCSEYYVCVSHYDGRTFWKDFPERTTDDVTGFLWSEQSCPHQYGVTGKRTTTSAYRGVEDGKYDGKMALEWQKNNCLNNCGPTKIKK